MHVLSTSESGHETIRCYDQCGWGKSPSLHKGVGGEGEGSIQ